RPAGASPEGVARLRSSPVSPAIVCPIVPRVDVPLRRQQGYRQVERPTTGQMVGQRVWAGPANVLEETGPERPRPYQAVATVLGGAEHSIILLQPLQGRAKEFGVQIEAIRADGQDAAAQGMRPAKAFLQAFAQVAGRLRPPDVG